MDTRHRISICTVLLMLSASVSANDADDQNFKARVSECQKELCLKEVSALYIWITDIELQFRDDVAEQQKWRRQLYDPVIWRMMEDGRWDNMSEEEKHIYAKEKGFGR